jgi:hypothetical protein
MHEINFVELHCVPVLTLHFVSLRQRSDTVKMTCFEVHIAERKDSTRQRGGIRYEIVVRALFRLKAYTNSAQWQRLG